MASFSLFVLKVFYSSFRESILSEKKEIINKEPEVWNWILDEANKKLRSTLKNKDFTAVSVGQAMIEVAHKKIKSANTGIFLNKKTKELWRERERKKKTVNNWHARRGTCSKKRKRTKINRLIDVKSGDP